MHYGGMEAEWLTALITSFQKNGYKQHIITGKWPHFNKLH